MRLVAICGFWTFFISHPKAIARLLGDKLASYTKVRRAIFYRQLILGFSQIFTNSSNLPSKSSILPNLKPVRSSYISNPYFLCHEPGMNLQETLLQLPPPVALSLSLWLQA